MGVRFVRKGSRKPERQNGSTWPNTCKAALSFWIVTGDQCRSRLCPSVGHGIFELARLWTNELRRLISCEGRAGARMIRMSAARHGTANWHLSAARWPQRFHHRRRARSFVSRTRS